MRVGGVFLEEVVGEFVKLVVSYAFNYLDFFVLLFNCFVISLRILTKNFLSSFHFT